MTLNETADNQQRGKEVRAGSAITPPNSGCLGWWARLKPPVEHSQLPSTHLSRSGSLRACQSGRFPGPAPGGTDSNSLGRGHESAGPPAPQGTPRPWVCGRFTKPFSPTRSYADLSTYMREIRPTSKPGEPLALCGPSFLPRLAPSCPRGLSASVARKQAEQDGG